MRFLTCIALSALAMGVAPARAQSTVITAITAEELATAVTEAGTDFGVPTSAETRTSPDTSFVVLADLAFPGDSASAPDTLRFFIGLDGCEEERCDALSAVAFFSTGEDGPGTDDMNAWNATRRLTRAYVTPDGLALQSDYDLAGGVTGDSVGRFIRSFLISLVTFADALQTTAMPAEPAPADQE